MINEGVRDHRGGLASADLILHSLDFSNIVALQKADRWDEAGILLGATGVRLASAGAKCLLICTNTMHMVANTVAQMSGVPLIDMIDETAAALKADSRRKPLVLATRYTMEHGFYADRMKSHGIDVIVPDAAARTDVHDIIFEELCRGEVRPDSRRRLLDICERAQARGVDSVILGCTELSLLVQPNMFCVPGYDSTAIHARAGVRFALASGSMTGSA
ncbi:aspartate/glutamate racemase family protein [Rhizobium lemnae]|uniref:Aspartate/glutamate racemase family protein n=1 Tax=Rhizobium lemnae TaxID=1214924 RepID=A0ABV8EFE8_9HYPH|nr:aspartate/glutamate racemase family protein [Rhizobium lemnae]MCJ8509926.1 aspartate/glutamate racemase family protein [Rhizobium lemnae]